MDYLEQSNISIARDNLIATLLILFFALVLFLFYYLLDEAAIRIYKSIFDAILPTAAFLIIVAIISLTFAIVGSSLFGVLSGNVYFNLIHSVYFRSQVRFFRRRYFSKRTSIPHILTSKIYKRVTEKLDSNLYIVFQYLIILVSLVLLSYGIISEILQGDISFLGKSWNRTTIWTIAQLQFTSISFGLIIIVFTLNFLDRHISPLEHGSVLLRDAILVRIIISATFLSIFTLLVILASDPIPDELYGVLVLFSFILFLIVVSSIFLIVERIIRTFLKTTERIHLSSFKAKVIKLSFLGRQKQDAAEILEKSTTSISNRSNQTVEPYCQITCNDVGGKPGYYIVDINKKIVKDLFQGSGDRLIHARFELSIGDRVDRASEPILSITNDIRDQEIERIKGELGSAIKFEGFDNRYNQDPWDQEYEMIEYLINEIEQNIEESIIKKNISFLRYNFHIYRQMIWSCIYHSTFQSLESLPRQPVDLIFQSIHRLFVACLEEYNVSEEEIYQEMLLEIIRFVYILSSDIEENFPGRPEHEKSIDLIQTFESELETNNTEIGKELQLLLQELQ